MRNRDITAALATDLSGTDPCGDRDCPRTDGVPCEYVDDEGTACGSSWCRDHLAVVDDRRYCLRHASTVRALEGSPLRPAVGNRCPSLVHWIGRHLDLEVRRLLEEVRDAGGEAIIARSVHALTRGDSTVWCTEWALQALEVTLRLSVEVTEAEPTIVVLRVDDDEWFRGEPPWIAARREPTRPNDPASRDEFSASMLSSLRTAVMRRRGR